MEDVKWSVIQIPAIIGLFIFSTILIADISNPKRMVNRKMVIFFIFEILLIWLLVTLFLVLTHIKLDERYLTNLTWTVIFLPIYAVYILSFFIICLLSPWFMFDKVKRYREMSLITMYWFGTLIFVLLLPAVLDAYLDW